MCPFVSCSVAGARTWAEGEPPNKSPQRRQGRAPGEHARKSEDESGKTGEKRSRRDRR